METILEIKVLLACAKGRFGGKNVLLQMDFQKTVWSRIFTLKNLNLPIK